MTPPPGRKLFVVTYHFPPDGAVGGWRWAGLTRYLRQLGWDCQVLTAAATPSAGQGVIVHHSARRRTLLERYKVRRLPPVEAGTSSPEPRKGLRLRAEIGAMLSLPDESRGWIIRAASHARRLIAALKPDVVVSSGPPHSAHLVTRLAVSLRRVRWYADLRDPWPQWLDQAALWNAGQQTLTARALMPLVERLAMGGVSGLIANTPPFAAELAARYSSLPVVWVRNGFDPERAPAPGIRPLQQRFVVSHAGSIYGTRSLDVALEGFRRFAARASLGPTEAAFQVIGENEEPHRSRLLDAISQRQLNDFVRFTGRVSPAEALRHLRHANVAVVLAQGQPRQVPAKLYECAGLSVPAIVLAERDSATAAEAAGLGSIVLDPDDADGIARVLEGARQNALPMGTPRPEVLYPDIANRVARLLTAHDQFRAEAVPPALKERPGVARPRGSPAAGRAP